LDTYKKIEATDSIRGSGACFTRTKLYTVTLVLMVHLKTVVKLFQTVFQLLVLPFSFVIEVLVSVDNEFTKISEVVS
jgi:hypothetical protein